MPIRDRERINRALNEIKADPLAGDITAPARSVPRPLSSSCRIMAHHFFGLKPENRVVLIGDIVRPTSTTY